MEKLLLRCAALGAIVVGMAACATPGGHSAVATAARPAPPLPGTEACFWLHNISGWDVLDQQTLIVYAPLQKDAYLVKLFEPVFDLDFRERIGFDDANHDDRVCSLGNNVLVHDMGQRRVPITSVRALTPADVKGLKAAAKARHNGNGSHPAAAPAAPNSPDAPAVPPAPAAPAAGASG